MILHITPFCVLIDPELRHYFKLFWRNIHFSTKKRILPRFRHKSRYVAPRHGIAVSPTVDSEHSPRRDLQILKFWHHNRFLAPKNIPIPIFRSKKSFYRVLLCFRKILGKFWAILGKIGDLWRHKRGPDLHFSKFWPHHWFSRHKKNIPIPIFRSEKSFYRVLLRFRRILGHFG